MPHDYIPACHHKYVANDDAGVFSAAVGAGAAYYGKHCPGTGPRFFVRSFGHDYPREGLKHADIAGLIPIGLGMRVDRHNTEGECNTILYYQW